LADFLYSAEESFCALGEKRMQFSGACPLQQIHGFGSVSIGRILYEHNMET